MFYILISTLDPGHKNSIPSVSEVGDKIMQHILNTLSTAT